MLIQAQGNIFDSKANILINPVNCIGVMGKGLAAEFRRRYPEYFKDYVKVCKDKLLFIGSIHIYNTTDKILISFPTKYHWRQYSEEYMIRASLLELKNYLKSMPLEASVALPAIGCGLGGMKVEVVSELVKEYLGDCKQNIYVFLPLKV